MQKHVCNQTFIQGLLKKCNKSFGVNLASQMLPIRQRQNVIQLTCHAHASCTAEAMKISYPDNFCHRLQLVTVNCIPCFFKLLGMFLLMLWMLPLLKTRSLLKISLVWIASD